MRIAALCAAVTAVNILLSHYHLVYTADLVAKVPGDYLVSIFLVPCILVSCL